MTLDSVKDSLKELQGKIKQTWDKLTEEDLKSLEGNVEEFVGRVQKAYGEKKEDILTKIDALRTKYTAEPPAKKQPRKEQSGHEL